MEYLVDNQLVSSIRVVDKVPPQTAWLNKKHQDIFDDPIVEFRSANLINTGIKHDQLLLHKKSCHEILCGLKRSFSFDRR